MTRSRRVKRLKHYSSAHSILIVGDGDFSFSLALATAFGSGENLVATSLDSYDVLGRKYTKAQSNVIELKRMGAKVLHGISAKSMRRHSYLETRRFHRIVFNFPHAGFNGKEYEWHVVILHKVLVKGFFVNAVELLQPDGEIHISHKTGHPYDAWDIEQLASESSLTMIGKVRFKKQDYPGYNQKRGDGAKSNQTFPLGDCSTFKFSMKHNEVQEEFACGGTSPEGAAVELLQPDGEIIHISHKTGHPYDAWDIEQLALESSLTMIDKVRFKKQDYPGYNQKRGDGAKSNQTFPLGDCSTFKFSMKHNEVQEEFACGGTSPEGAAVELLQPDGEIHISHKTGHPYDAWDIEQLASESSLTMIDKVRSKKQDYPGYNQKRGDGAKSNQTFPLGDCSTFKFSMKHNEVQEEFACGGTSPEGAAVAGHQRFRRSGNVGFTSSFLLLFFLLGLFVLFESLF